MRCPDCQYQPAPASTERCGCYPSVSKECLPVRFITPDSMIGGSNYQPPSGKPEIIVYRLSDMRRAPGPFGGRTCRDEDECLYEPRALGAWLDG